MPESVEEVNKDANPGMWAGFSFFKSFPEDNRGLITGILMLPVLWGLGCLDCRS